MSAREYREWFAWETVFGSVDSRNRIDQAAALIAERITNMLRDGGRPAGVDDFRPIYRKEVEPNGNYPQPDDSFGD